MPLITVAASLGGVYMGQRMIAIGESNKLIREKLERIYDITLSIPDLAIAVNTSATEKVTAIDANAKAAIYNEALNKYQEKIIEIEKINTLYVEEISGAVTSLQQCSKKFIDHAVNHLLLERRDAGFQILGPLKSYEDPNKNLEREESLNSTVLIRLECEETGKALKLTIAKEMKKHI